MRPDERTAGGHPLEEIPFYVGGGLSARARERVRAHLEGCAACRAEEAFWAGVAQAIRDEDAALDVPRMRLPNVGRPASPAVAWLGHRLRRVGQLLWAQARVLDRRIWGASALVLGLGFAVMAVGAREAGARWVAGVAPLVAAAGIALVEHPRQDPAWELTLAAPTSPGTLLLARAALLFGFDALIALAVTAATGPASWSLLGSVVLGWLAPMMALSCLALFLSLLLGPQVAAMGSLVIWVLASAPPEAWVVPGHAFGTAVPRVLGAVLQGPWAWPASAFFIAAALVLAGREAVQVSGMQG